MPTCVCVCVCVCGNVSQRCGRMAGGSEEDDIINIFMSKWNKEVSSIVEIGMWGEEHLGRNLQFKGEGE